MKRRAASAEPHAQEIRKAFLKDRRAATFHAFATYFRDVLKAPDALYLDGTISRVFAPELGRNDQGLAMGPIVGVVAGRSAN